MAPARRARCRRRSLPWSRSLLVEARLPPRILTRESHPGGRGAGPHSRGRCRGGFAHAGKTRAGRGGGWRGSLARWTFAALAYNWGRAPQAFAQATDLRTVPIPASAAAYAVRFSQALRQAREKARADNDTLPGRWR